MIIKEQTPIDQHLNEASDKDCGKYSIQELKDLLAIFESKSRKEYALIGAINKELNNRIDEETRIDEAKVVPFKKLEQAWTRTGGDKAKQAKLIKKHDLKKIISTVRPGEIKLGVKNKLLGTTKAATAAGLDLDDQLIFVTNNPLKIIYPKKSSRRPEGEEIKESVDVAAARLEKMVSLVLKENDLETIKSFIENSDIDLSTAPSKIREGYKTFIDENRAVVSNPRNIKAFIKQAEKKFPQYKGEIEQAEDDEIVFPNDPKLIKFFKGAREVKFVLKDSVEIEEGKDDYIVVIQGAGDNKQKIVQVFKGTQLDKAKKYRDDWNKKNANKIKKNKKGQPMAAHGARLYNHPAGSTVNGKPNIPKVGDSVSWSTFGKRVIKESTAEYAKSLEKIANDRKMKNISKKDRETLKKIAALMANEDLEEDAISRAKEKADLKKKHQAEIEREKEDIKDISNEDVEIAENKTGIQNKADKTGISYSILKKVFDRGVAAWRTGHRPGTTPSQWGFARINSFATGGKTRTTADKDLWAQHKGNKKEALEYGSPKATKVYKKATPGENEKITPVADLEEASKSDIKKVLASAKKAGGKIKGNKIDFGMGTSIEVSIDKGRIKLDGGRDGIEYFKNAKDAVMAFEETQQFIDSE